MKTQTEIRIANLLPDPAKTARSIHRQAAALVVPCACGSTRGVQWRGLHTGLRSYDCADCWGEYQQWSTNEDAAEQSRRATHGERGAEL